MRQVAVSATRASGDGISSRDAQVAAIQEELVKTRAFWGLGLTLAICAVLAGCSSQQAKSAKASGPPPAVPVGVATVKQGDFNVYLTGLGSVQAF